MGLPVPPSYREVSDRAAEALRQNPTAIAGLADFDDTPAALQTALAGVANCVRIGRSDRYDAGATVYALVRVAQEDYGGDRGYWPQLSNRLGLNLEPSQQRLLGEWFRDGLDRFGYHSNVAGQSHLGPILWHAGWSCHQLQAIMRFVVAQVDAYRDRACEPDAPHELQLGKLASTWNPPLPRTVIRLLQENAAGIGDLWARLARAAREHRRGKSSAVVAAWEPIGGIEASHVVEALRELPPGPAAPKCPPRPRLRYHPDTGELRLWLAPGDSAANWTVHGLKLRWEGNSAVVMPPLPARYKLRHKQGIEWNESLFLEGRPALWFGGRSGVLEQADTVDGQGLAAGPWYLVCQGDPNVCTVEDRRPLSLAYLVGGEGWKAWCVEVPERGSGARTFSMRVAGKSWDFPLARGIVLRVTAEEPAARGELADGTPILVYGAAPKVDFRQRMAVRLVRRTQSEGEPIQAWDAPLGAGRLPDVGSGVFQLREARGVGRVLLNYAVVPGFAAPKVTVAAGAARLFVPVGSSGSIHGGTKVSGGWAFERPDTEPWLEATWQWDASGLEEIRLRFPVRAVRWRLFDQNGERSAWGREPIAVARREVTAKRLKLRVEVPTHQDVLINGHPPKSEPEELPTGWAFDVSLDAYPTVDAIRLTASGVETVAAWLTDRPVLREFEVTIENGTLVTCWDAEHMPASVTLAFWDPTDPAGPLVYQPVSKAELDATGGEWSLPTAAAGFRFVSVALGTQLRQGFGPAKFTPAASPQSGEPVTTLASRDAGEWAKLAHRWTVRHRWGGDGSIQVELQAAGDEVLVNDVLDYAHRLPVESHLRSKLMAVAASFGEAAAAHVASSDDPVAAMQNWLAVGVHPFWAGDVPSGKWSNIPAYPFDYLGRLDLLEERDAPLETRIAAAAEVYKFHHNYELFSPLAGLPLAALGRHGVITAQGKTSDGKATHRHQVSLAETPPDCEEQFIAQTTGHDGYWLASALPADAIPLSETRAVLQPAGRPSALGGWVRGSTQYSIGRSEEGYWQFDRKQVCKERNAYRPCCTVHAPLTAKPWDPETLVAHLRLVDWLIGRSARVKPPAAVLPVRYDELLFAGPLAAIHRRVLETPPMREVTLQPNAIRVVGTLTVREPKYPDVPTAGKFAWRLAWLDRMSPANRAAIADWQPFYDALAAALNGPEDWCDLLAGCVIAAEYVRRILAGGIGPVLRFAASEQPKDAVREPNRRR